MRKESIKHGRTCVYNVNYPQFKQRLRGGHLWNSSFYLETIGSISEEAGESITCYQQKATLPERKKHIAALKEVYSQVLQSVVRHIGLGTSLRGGMRLRIPTNR